MEAQMVQQAGQPPTQPLSTTQAPAVQNWYSAHENARRDSQNLIQCAALLASVLGIMLAFAGLMATAKSVSLDVERIDKKVYSIGSVGTPTPQGGLIYDFQGQLVLMEEPLYKEDTGWGTFDYIFWVAIAIAILVSLVGPVSLWLLWKRRSNSRGTLDQNRNALVVAFQANPDLLERYLKPPEE